MEKSALHFWLFRSVFAGNGILLKSLLCVWLAGPCTVHTSQNGRWKDFRFTSFQCAAFCCIMRLCVETMLPHYGLTRGGWRNSWLIDSTAGSHCGTADWTHTHTHTILKILIQEINCNRHGVKKNTRRVGVNEKKDSLKLFLLKTPNWQRKRTRGEDHVTHREARIACLLGAKMSVRTPITLLWRA